MDIGMIGRVAMALLLLNIAACSTYRPLPVHEPVPTKAAGKFYPLRGMPPPTELEEAKGTLYAYANAYMARAETLTSANYNAADATVLGGLVGTAGGLTKSPEAAITGTVIAGGAGVFAQRYGLPVQVSSHLGAGQAMECMATVLIYGKGPDVTAAWEQEVAVPTQDQIDFAFLNQRIDQVRRKLRSRLTSIDISTADITALKSSLADQIEAEREARSARAAKSVAVQAKAHADEKLAQERTPKTRGAKAGQGKAIAKASTLNAAATARIALDAASLAVRTADRAVIHTSLAACANAY